MQIKYLDYFIIFQNYLCWYLSILIVVNTFLTCHQKMRKKMAVRMGMRGAKLRCVRLNWTKRIRKPPAMRLSTPERSGVKIKKTQENNFLHL